MGDLWWPDTWRRYERWKLGAILGYSPKADLPMDIHKMQLRIHATLCWLTIGTYHNDTFASGDLYAIQIATGIIWRRSDSVLEDAPY